MTSLQIPPDDVIRQSSPQRSPALVSVHWASSVHGRVVPVTTQSGPWRHGPPNSSTTQSVLSQFRPSS